MRKQAIQKAVDAKIALGYSRQHAYDELRLEYPEASSRKLANLVRYTPSLAARQRYRTEHGALLMATGLHVLLPVMHVFAMPGRQSLFGQGLFAAIPFAMIGIAIAIARYRLHVLPWLIVIALLSLFRGYNHQEEVLQDTWTIVAYVLTAIIAGLSILLHQRLASNYAMDRNFTPPHAIFPQEDGNRFM